MAKKKKKSKITLNVQIPIMLHEQFKAYAKAQGEPMRFFVQQDIKARLAAGLDAVKVKIANGDVFLREMEKYKNRQRNSPLIDDLNKL
jgi:hypothetical protein